jgi:hypothetical protein
MKEKYYRAEDDISPTSQAPKLKGSRRVILYTTSTSGSPLDPLETRVGPSSSRRLPKKKSLCLSMVLTVCEYIRLVVDRC